MSTRRIIAAIACVLVAACVGLANAEIVTCGGFVKASANLAQAFADVKLDYSIVKMHLYTVDGLLKYSAECAPNGYYFIPVYDRGSFYLQIEGPAGWTFEPTRVPFTVDANSESHDGGAPAAGACAEDINFRFTGFTLSGRVLASSSPSCSPAGSAGGGPAGISLTLVNSGTGQIEHTTSLPGGHYEFKNVFPGSYSVSATHPTFSLTPATHQVSMANWGNAVVKDAFQLNGYEISGVIQTSGESAPGVDVFLYGSDDLKIEGCAPVGKDVAKPDRDEFLLCATQSSASGSFRFTNVPCGVYTLVPFYKRTHTMYDVVPSSKLVNVSHHAGSVVLADAFQVMGFSVSGKVVDRSGAGIEGASISVDGVVKTTTDKTGSYKLEQIQTGKYNIKATKPHVFFRPLQSIQVLPSTGALPNIVVSTFHVCGRVDSGETVSSRTVSLADSQGNELTTTTTDADGQYCFEVAPGTFAITPALTRGEKAKSILLSPPTRTITVNDSPVLSAHFVQARVRVSGRVKCIAGSPCNTANTLKVVLMNKNEDQRMLATVTAADTFSFADVLPGTYNLSVSQSSWCFERQQIELNVEYVDIENIEFSQSGYLLAATVSHDIKLAVTGAGSYEHTADVKAGAVKLCLPRAGVYTVKPESCYRFARESYSYDTSAPAIIDLTAADYRVSGTVEASSTSAAANVRTLPVKITHGSAAEVEVVATFDRTEARAGKGQVRVYKYSFWASASVEVGTPYVITTPVHPSANPSEQTDVLFYPRTREVTIRARATGCPAAVEPFEGRAGVYVSGTVSPATAGVTITVVSSKQTEQSVLTDSYGAYRAGPLYDDQTYKVSASADGYHFKEESAGHFRAVKLGSIALTIVDANNQPVAGVLCSLSGGDGYRRTNQTDASGKFVFSQLFPGDYFLRPLLKEYEFDPSTRSVTVTDASRVSESFSANRIAYSVFGVVRSLNGEAEKLAVVEAFQDGVADGQPRRYEETKTDSTGSYRLRGLMPNLTYKVAVKLAKPADGTAASADAVRIERATPAFVSVKVGREDILGADFIAFRRTNKFDLTGTVNATAAIVNTQLQQLEVVVAHAATPTVAYKTHALTRGFPFFEFSALAEDSYVVFVRPSAGAAAAAPSGSTVPVITTRTHAVTAPEVTVTLNAHTHVNPVFDAEFRAAKSSDDDSDEATTSIGNPSNPASSLLTLVLAVGVVLAAFNRKKVQSWIDAAKRASAAAGATQSSGDDSTTPKRGKKSGKKSN